MKRSHRIADDDEITDDVVSRIADALGVTGDSRRVALLKQCLLRSLDLARTATTLGSAGSGSSRKLAFERIAKWAKRLEEHLASNPLDAKAIAKTSVSLFAAIGPECEEIPWGPEQNRIRAILQWHFVAAARERSKSAAQHSSVEQKEFRDALKLIEDALSHLQNNLPQLQAAVSRIKTAALTPRDKAAAEPKASRQSRRTPNQARPLTVRYLLDIYQEFTGNRIQFGTTTDGTHFSGPLISYLSAVLPLFGSQMSPTAIRSMIQDLPPDR